MLALLQAPAWAQNRQQEAQLAYLRDMPSPEAVVAAFSGSTPAQTLGRQCAALTLLFRGRLLPDLSFSKPGVALAERYRAAAAAVERQYSGTIRPLDNPEYRREWNRMCENRRSGLNPLTGKEEGEGGFPALDKPVSLEELLPLFKPSVRAALDRVAAENKALAAAQTARNEAMVKQSEAANARATKERLLSTVMGLVGTVGLGLLAWLLVWVLRSTLRMGARLTADGGLLINGKAYQVQQFGGRLVEARRALETVVQHTGGGNTGRPLQVSSRTIVHDHLRIEDTQGRPHSLHLVDWNLECTQGDTLQCYTLARQGQVDQECTVIVNRSLGRSWSAGNSLSARLAPVHGLLAIVLVLVAGLATLGIGWLVGGGWIFYSSRRMNRTRAEVVQLLTAYQPLAAVPRA